MRNIVFNSFKEKVLSGKVPEVIEASGLAVKSDFFDQYDNTDISLEQYRNIEDFKTYSRNVRGMKSMDSTLFEYSSFKVEYSAYEPDDYGSKPFFVNCDNSGKFFQAFQNDVGDEETKKRLIGYMSVTDPTDTEAVEDLRNTNSGFYYVTKKSHLNWLADRTNNDNNFNNKIRIVLGDDIGNQNDRDIIESIFCTSPERPFNGIFDLNGHKIRNKRFLCKNNSNGLIGYLGPRGVVRNGIIEDYVFDCRKKISLDKIVNDCSDVFAGALVGTNWGTVENIITSGEFRFDGFCPEVYLVNNKYEYTEGDSTNTNSAYNGFFPNKFCINSVYNILPYCGYFNEGIDSTYNDIGRSNIAKLFTTSVNTIHEVVKYNANSVLGYVDYTGHEYENSFNFQHYSEPMASVSDMFDQSSIRLAKAIPSTDSNGTVSNISLIESTLSYCLGNISNLRGNAGDKAIIEPLIPVEYTQYHLDRVACNTINNLGQWETHDGKDTYSITPLGIDQEGEMIRKDFDHGAYLMQQLRDAVEMSVNGVKNAHHQRMNPNARIAYYCSPIVGNNFGVIRNIDCRHTIVESMDTFVGFIGNVCGKQNCGTITNVSSLYSVRELNYEEKASAKNLTRNYTREHQLKPDYPDNYTNIVQLLAYNYDYYQNPNGIPNRYKGDTFDTKHQNGEDVVRVSQKFYDFHDFVCSGVSKEWYKSTSSNSNEYTFNVYTNKSPNYDNCNFCVDQEQKSFENIGSGIPEKIRNAKLKFGYTSDVFPNKFQIYFDLEEFEKEGGGNYPYQGEVKIFDSFDDAVPGNSVKSFIGLEAADRETLKNLLRSINFTVKHFDFNYLGDACKSVSVDDNITDSLKSHKNSSDETVQLTAKDVLENAVCFNDTGVSTRDGAIHFAKNMMYSKIALGGNLLGNPYFDLSRNTPEYWKPFENVNGPFGTTNFTKGSDEDAKFIIKAHTGPNDTDSDWTIFTNDNDGHPNGPDMCWYMPPAPSTYAGGGPTAPDPERSLYRTINSKAFDTNFFCSIRPDYNFDIYARNNPAVKDFAQFGIQRSMITITPMSSESLDQVAHDLVVFLEDKLNAFEYYTRKSDGNGKTFDTPEARLEDAFGEDWFAKITKISIPTANRTQNKTYSSNGSFEGESGVNGLYLDLVDCAPKNVVDIDSNGKFKWDDDADPYDEHTQPYVGNLDDMFIEMTLFKVITPEVHSPGSHGIEPEYLPYNMIIRAPIRRLRIPISAYSSEAPTVVQTVKLTENFSKFEDPVAGETDTHNERRCKFYPLMPAYDPEEKNGAIETFNLRSIYNIGGVAGMVNHSEKYEEYGNWGIPDIVFNHAQMGVMQNIMVKMTNESMSFINRLVEVNDQNDDEEFRDINPRVIGIASKFGLIAPVFEYHQNEVGTSPNPGMREVDNTNLLTFVPACQYTKFEAITLIGPTENSFKKRYENNKYTGVRGCQQINTRLFNSFIEWINFCDVLDYNNFFYKRYCWNIDAHTIYTPWTSMNYPETVNIMHNFCSLASSDGKYNLKALWAYNGFCNKDFWPVAGPCDPTNPLDPRNLYHGAEDNSHSDLRFGTDQLWQFGSNGGYIRKNGIKKRYNYVPSYVIWLANVFDIPDGYKRRVGTDWLKKNQWNAHMSPMINSVNSDYGDINSQLLNGSPNFCFDKLNKTIEDAPLISVDAQSVENQIVAADGYERQIPFINEAMYNLYMNRIQNNITDRYFTWDYDMYPRGYNDPLEFVIKYKNVKNTRGLWIHQQIRDVDKPDPDNWLRYAMKGKDECMNDGSSIHLGYMPSEWALINIMNRDDRNILPSQVGDEGIAVSGDDFRGILLFEKKTNDLIAMVDGGYGRNINSGCYIAELPKKFVENEVSGYGLLCEIDAE